MSLEFLKHSIKEKSVYYNKDLSHTFSSRGYRFLLDLREVLLDPQFVDQVAEIFWATYGNRSVLQVAGLELASVPLMTAIILKASTFGCKANALIVRKSRKKYGLERMIEGKFDRDIETVIIDDLVNSGASVQKCMVSLGEMGIYPRQVFSIVDFGGEKKNQLFASRGLNHQFLFSIEELVDVSCAEKGKVDLGKYETIFCFRSGKPSNTHQIFCRSNPIVDDRHVYFGTDMSVFYALNKDTGECVWKQEGPNNGLRKGIWSSPCLIDEGICFGSYDGNLYYLERQTGRPIWIFSKANFIGSSPVFASDLRLIFVGLEYAIPGRGGSIAAVDLDGGQLRWEHLTHFQVHSSPVYSKKNGMVICGSNDRDLIALDAQTGELLWRRDTLGICKMKVALSEGEEFLFGSFTDSSVKAFDSLTGNEIWRFETKAGNLATPLLIGKFLVVGSLDNCIYFLDRTTGKVLETIQTDGRIMSEPSYCGEHLLIGNNSGAVLAIKGDFIGGQGGSIEITGRYQLPDRVTSRIAHCDVSGFYYAHTADDRLFAFREA